MTVGVLIRCAEVDHSTVSGLFRDEYKLPLLSPEVARASGHPGRPRILHDHSDSMVDESFDDSSHARFDESSDVPRSLSVS